jgi:alanyl-tRNA synthetase
VTHTSKLGADLIVHKGLLGSGEIAVGDTVVAEVDAGHRRSTAGNHTATHLLHAALREVLGDHVKQAGSLVSADRLRFDFSHFAQVSQEKLMEIERLVNRHIRENLPLITQVMSKDEAMKTGAMAIFEEKYGDMVRLVTIGDGVSRELCGGTHAERTGDIGLFRIVSEGAVAANMRRIEALTGDAAFEYTLQRDRELRTAASLLKASPDQVGDKIERLLKTLKDHDKEIETLTARLRIQKSDDLLAGIKEINGIRAIAREVEAGSPKELRDWGDRIKDKLGSGVVLIGARAEGKAMLTCLVTNDLTKQFHAGEIIRQVSGIVGGKGGGRPNMAQGGGDQPEKLGEALDAFYGLLEKDGMDRMG